MRKTATEKILLTQFDISVFLNRIVGENVLYCQNQGFLLSKLESGATWFELELDLPDQTGV